MELFEVLQYEWAIRALITSALVGIMCGILGCFILLRNMALIGDALSHAILPGVVVGFVVAGHSVFAFFIGAVSAGLISAVMITWIQRNVKSKEDAAIGIVFTVMFAAGIIGISHISRQEGVHLDMKDFLFGNVLGIGSQDLYLTFFITLFVLLSVITFYRYLFITTFQEVVARTMGISVNVVHYFLMLLLSFAVVASLQSVGVILVVAMLIIPASTAYLLTNRLNRMLIIAAFLGLFSTTIGLLLAIVFETTPGPAMTLTAGFFYLLAVIFAPGKGVLSKYLTKRGTKFKVLEEDAIKQLVKLKERDNLSLQSLQKRLDVNAFQFKRIIKRLKARKLIKMDGVNILLTNTGLELAYQLIRAHRLWETYLSKTVGLSEEQIHDQAEKLEHVLPETFLQEVETRLGYPTLDPHGSAIPQHGKVEDFHSIQNLLPNQRAIVTTKQSNDDIAIQLWQLGITPAKPFSLIELSESFAEILMDDKPLRLERTLADSIKIAIIEN